MLKIALVSASMAMYPGQYENESLGGSEIAQLCVGEELAKLDVRLHQYTTQHESVAFHQRGQYWHDIREWWDDGCECDVAIICRAPWLMHSKIKAKRKILWIQDFMTDDYPNANDVQQLLQFDEIWAVSWWQMQQWLSKCAERGFALDVGKFYVTRNGISRVTAPREPRDEYGLFYGSRPERGLWDLVRPDGIMDRLPQYHLTVCGYADYPAQNREFYEYVWGLCDNHPRVNRVGPQSQPQMRQWLQKSAALVLPTNYAETSCMMARESIERLRPVFYTQPSKNPAATDGGGALMETVGNCGLGMNRDGKTPDEYASLFASGVLMGLENEALRLKMRSEALDRYDLHWDLVARAWVRRLEKQV